MPTTCGGCSSVRVIRSSLVVIVADDCSFVDGRRQTVSVVGLLVKTPTAIMLSAMKPWMKMPRALKPWALRPWATMLMFLAILADPDLWHPCLCTDTDPQVSPHTRPAWVSHSCRRHLAHLSGRRRNASGRRHCSDSCYCGRA